jgi:hypothetical protein
MNAVRDKKTTDAWPTPEHPHIGSVGLGSDDLALSKVAYWRDGGTHVFRSVEYDVISADEDFHEAVVAFVRDSVDYAKFLSEDDDPTPADLAIANMIFARVVRLREELDRRREREWAILRRLRHRGHGGTRGWPRDFVAQI